MAFADTAADKEIVKNIQHKFAAEEATSGVQIVIVSQDGIVTLSGKVDTDGEASKLVEIAEGTYGVKDVKLWLNPRLNILKSLHSSF